MRYITLCLFMIAASLSAQVEYGTITYLRTSEVRMPIDEENPTPQDKQIREMMAKMQASGAFNKTFRSSFSPTAFNCIEEHKDPTEVSSESGGSVMVIMTSDDDPAHFYTDTQNGDVTNTDLIFDRKFLVTGNPEPIEWELTGEVVAPSEMTAGLDLLIAKGVSSDGDTLIAGYAKSLPVQVGPMNYHGLPGAIITLEITRGTGATVYRATQIDLSQDPIEIEKPTEGKAIGLEKFKEERKKRKRTMKRTIHR